MKHIIIKAVSVCALIFSMDANAWPWHLKNDRVIQVMSVFDSQTNKGIDGLKTSQAWDDYYHEMYALLKAVNLDGLPKPFVNSYRTSMTSLLRVVSAMDGLLAFDEKSKSIDQYYANKISSRNAQLNPIGTGIRSFASGIKAFLTGSADPIIEHIDHVDQKTKDCIDGANKDADDCRMELKQVAKERHDYYDRTVNPATKQWIESCRNLRKEAEKYGYTYGLR